MTGKTKTAWFCSSCGNEYAKWLGQCPACGEWNTMVEEKVATGGGASSRRTSQRGAAGGGGGGAGSRKTNSPVPLSQVSRKEDERIGLNMPEVDRLLGGGLVKGSLVLIGGEPGIGKSTLSLQIPLRNPSLKVLYVTGEESVQQVKMRAARIGGAQDKCLILSETQMDEIILQAEREAPDLVIVDSVQTMFAEGLEGSPGSVSQVRECACMLLRYAKDSGTPVLLIGHITKEGSIAGPKVLEHIVDVVLQFEGENRGAYRLLRGIKNRFGSTSELAVFEMTGTGLEEVTNPSGMLVPMHGENLSGIAVSAMLDGTRPFLMEVQALVSTAAYGTPQRSATGFDQRRLNMLLAVLEKRAGFKLGAKDVFINMAGGLRVTDPACDLAVVASVLSSTFDLPIDSDSCFAGEVGLSGEIRPAVQTERRIAEASRLGYKRIFVSKYASIPAKESKIQIVKIADVPSLVKSLFR